MSGPRFWVVLTSVILFASNAQVFAQSFSMTLGDTVRSGRIGSEIIFEAKIENTSSGELTLAFVRTDNALPVGWQSAMCIDVLCFSSTLDSVALTSDFGCSPLRTGDSTTFSVHVTPQTNLGTGTVRVVVKDVKNPADSKAVRFITHATSNGVTVNKDQPTGFALLQNYPNPFNPTTVVRYQLPVASDVKLVVYDILGRAVATLVNEKEPPGVYEVQFDASVLAGGVYWYRLVSEGSSITRSMILLK